MCGGTNDYTHANSTISGLSPRVRGNPVHRRWPAELDGSIPACAGEPAAAGAGPTGRGVYPRVCGGTAAAACTSAPALGLSPRVRGNPYAAVCPAPAPGSIPACAGEPIGYGAAHLVGGVYPRVCGGTVRPHIGVQQREGLSPRVRGNPGWRPAALPTSRSIPACAGEPVSVAACHASEAVYPRVCGGTCSIPTVPGNSWGLSPRVRGNP